MGSAVAEFVDHVLESLPVAALRVRADGTVAFSNDAFRRTFGPEAADAAMQALSRSTITRSGVTYDVKVTEDPASGFVVVFARQHAAPEPDVEKRRGFLSIASHDLRGILANVRSWASILTSGKVALDDRGRRAAEVISRNTDKAIALMQEFFDSARADLTSVPVEIQPEDLRPELSRAIEDLQKGDSAGPVELTVRSEAELSAVPVDIDRFRHMLRAFLGHARERAGANAGVQLTVQPGEGGVWFLVRDHGAPLTSDERALAFERDDRTLAERKLGSGFRLAFAAAEVAAHRGRVMAHAEPDGATFGFWLPAQTPLVASEPASVQGH